MDLTNSDIVARLDKVATCQLLRDWRGYSESSVLAEIWQWAARYALDHSEDAPGSDEAPAAVERLAKETRDAARRFIDGIGWARNLPGFPAGPDEEAILRRIPDPDGDGVPALSLALADFIRELDRAGADDWLDAERNRATERLKQYVLPFMEMIKGPPAVLPGWYVTVFHPDFWVGSGPPPDWAHGYGHSSNVGYAISGGFDMTAKATLVPDIPRAARTLALAVWIRVRKELENERKRAERRITVAQPDLFWQAVARLDSPVVARDDGKVVRADGRETGLVVAPGVGIDAVRSLLRLGRGAFLHTLAAQRTIAWFATVAHQCDVHGGVVEGQGWLATRQPRGAVLVVVEGGHERLAALVGEHDKNKHDVPYLTMRALTGLIVSARSERIRDATGGMVQQTRDVPSHTGQRARVEVELSWMWSPDAVQGFGSFLVPVLRPPPMRGIGPRAQPGVAAMERLALCDLTMRSDELARYGAVRLDWHRLGREAGVSVEIADRAVALWQDRGRWHSEVGGWRLGDADDDTRLAHELLEANGRRRLASSIRGRASADRKKKGAKKAR